MQVNKLRHFDPLVNRCTSILVESGRNSGAGTLVDAGGKRGKPDIYRLPAEPCLWAQSINLVNQNWPFSLFESRWHLIPCRQESYDVRDMQRTFITMTVVLACGISLNEQPHTLGPPGSAPATKPNAPPSEEDINAARDQLFQLLKMSPKLTTVVIRDPSLLSDQGYVSRNNPELAQFLESHPEIARNPDFYLFANVGGPNRERRLEREIWPGMGN